MDLKQLEYFVRVAELGSFTRAAIELDVAQPALSRQVRLLEVELRQTLLVRNGRGAVPTEAGKLLLDHGRGILHQVERAREDLGRLRGGLSGRVAVGLPNSVARVLTVPLTRAVREALPEARLSISEGLSSGLQEGLASGRLDIVVLYNAQPSRELDLTPLLEEDLLLVQARPPGLPEDPPPGAIPLEEVAKLPLVAQPGTRWNYSVSIDVLCRLIEVISGRPYDVFLTERLLKPLGMEDTTFNVPSDRMDHLSACYAPGADGRPELQDDPAASRFAGPLKTPFGGALVSTASDYMRFCQFLLSKGACGDAHLLGRKTMEVEILREALSKADSKKRISRPILLPKDGSR